MGLFVMQYSTYLIHENIPQKLNVEVLVKAEICCRFRFIVLVSEGPTLNISTAMQYNVTEAPFILDNVQEGKIYSFAVMLETNEGYRSQMSEVAAVEMPVG